MPRRIIKQRGAEKTETENGLWEHSTKLAIEKSAMLCSIGELCGSDQSIIDNITSQMNPSRRLEKIKQQTTWILEVANNVRNTKIGNIEASLNEEEGMEILPSPPAEVNQDIISIGSSDVPSPDAISSPDSADQEINSPARSPPIPGLEPSEPSSQSTLGSLPSRPRSSPDSYNNPYEAAEMFGFEPQEPFIVPPEPVFQPQEENVNQPIDENDAMDALNDADANIGVGIEDRMLAEIDFDQILANFYQ